ncbi:MAG: preprotein translocase subunit YajC [Vicinamibacterales bacterium]
MLMFPVSVVAMGAAPQGGAGWVQFVPILLIVGIMYFVLLQPMRKKEQKAQEFRDGLKVGDRVITTSGIYGQVTRLGEESLQLQIADKVKIEIARASVGGYQGKPQVVEPAPQ